MSRVLRTVPLILALAAFGIFASSCGTDHSQVRFLQASPEDAPAPVNVDITIDSKSVATNVAFGATAPSSGYQSVNAGNRTVEVFATGTTTSPLVNSNINFSNQKQYTVVIAGCNDPGSCNQSGTTSTIAPVLLTDDNTAPTSGNIKLRMVHASPFSNATNFDVYIVAPGTDITTLTPNISNLPYTQGSGYQSLAAATYEVIVTDTGSKVPIIDQSYPLTAGQIRTLVIVDILGGGALSTVPLELSDLN